MVDVVFRHRAWRDLDQVHARIAAEDVRAARRFRAKVIQRLALLQRLPESAQPRPEFGPGIRTIPIGHYIVILRVALPRVIILRILHGARDIPRLLKD